MAKSLEEIMTRLEKIVADLDGQGLSLEDALKLYEEGIGLSQSGEKVLIAAEKKIEELSNQPE